NVSCCGGPPCKNKKITLLARPNVVSPESVAASEREASRLGSDSPASPKPPIRNSSRRLGRRLASKCPCKTLSMAQLLWRTDAQWQSPPKIFIPDHTAIVCIFTGQKEPHCIYCCNLASRCDRVVKECTRNISDIEW